MVRLIVDLELEQVRAIVRDLDRTLDPVGFARLHGSSSVSHDYPVDLAGAENPLVLKIYTDEPAWIVAKELFVAGCTRHRAAPQFPHRSGFTIPQLCSP